MDIKADNPVKLIGYTSWTGGPGPDLFEQPISRAFRRAENTIVFGIEVKGFRYEVVLNSNDSLHFAGHFIGRKGPHTNPVDASATLYSNAKGIMLYGTWIEYCQKYTWIVSFVLLISSKTKYRSPEACLLSSSYETKECRLAR